MNPWNLLTVAFGDVIRSLRRRGLLPATRPTVRPITRHDGSGRSWSVEDSGPLEVLLKLTQVAATPASPEPHRARHHNVAPVSPDWKPVIGAHRISAMLDDTGVWSRSELEEMLTAGGRMDPELVEMGAPV